MYDFTTIMNRSGKDALAVDCIGVDVCCRRSMKKFGFKREQHVMLMGMETE